MLQRNSVVGSCCFVGALRRSALKLDIATDFLDEQPVIQNVLTHSTSPTAYTSICESGKIDAFVSDDITYDGFEISSSEPIRSAFFATNPATGHAIFPFSRYPRHLKVGAPIKIILVPASVLLDAQYKLFYVASTPSQFGQEYMRVFQSHVLVVRVNDQKNLALAEAHFTPLNLESVNSSVQSAPETDQNSLPSATASSTEPSNSSGDIQPDQLAPQSPTKRHNTVTVSGHVNELPTEFTHHHNAISDSLIRFDADRRMYVATRVRVGKRTFPNNVMVSFCGGWSFDAGRRLRCIDGTKVYYEKERLVCPRQSDDDGCAFTTHSLSYLKQHYWGVHMGLKPYVCTKCNEIFTQKGGLQRHMHDVHDDMNKSFLCSECGVAFKRQATLNSHVADVHQKKKVFSCHQCSLRFARKSGLTRHERDVHKCVKKFRCPQCDASFARNCTLKTHIVALHDKTKDHRCGQCDRSFALRTTLNQHVLVVHGPKRFHCAVCNGSFVSKANLKRHHGRKHAKVS